MYSTQYTSNPTLSPRHPIWFFWGSSSETTLHFPALIILPLPSRPPSTFPFTSLTLYSLLLYPFLISSFTSLHLLRVPPSSIPSPSSSLLPHSHHLSLLLPLVPSLSLPLLHRRSSACWMVYGSLNSWLDIIFYTNSIRCTEYKHNTVVRSGHATCRLQIAYTSNVMFCSSYIQWMNTFYSIYLSYLVLTDVCYVRGFLVFDW